MLVSLAVRVHLLLARPLWHDERYTAWISRRPAGEIVSALRRDSGPPAFYLLERLTGAASAPASRAWMLRGISFAASVVLLVVLGATLRGRRRAAALALASGFALLNLYAAEARAYALLALLVFAVFRTSRYGPETPPRLAGALAAATLALYTHYLALFAVLAAGALALAAGRRRSAAACAAALVLFVPWAPILIGQPPQALAWLRESPSETLFGFASALGGVGRVPAPFGPALAPALVALGAATGLVLLALAAGAARRDPDVRPAVAFVVLVLGLAFTVSALRPLAFAGRSELAVLPVWIWALARGWDEGRGIRIAASAAAALGLAATLLVALSPHRVDTAGAAVRRLSGMTRRGDAVVAGPGFYLPARLAADRGDLPATVAALPAEDAEHPGWFVAAPPGPAEEREVARTMDALPPGGRLFLLIPPPHQTAGIMRTLFSRGTVREIVRQPDAVLLLWSASATPSP